jgi:hypothetical protein
LCFVTLCTILLASIVPTLWKYGRAIPPSVVPQVSLSPGEKACLLQRDFCLKNEVLSILNTAFIARVEDNLLFQVDPIVEPAKELFGTEVSAAMMAMGPLISADRFHRFLSEFGPPFPSNVRQRLVQKGLRQPRLRVFIWCGIVTGFAWLSTLVLREWRIDAPLRRVSVIGVLCALFCVAAGGGNWALMWGWSMAYGLLGGSSGLTGSETYVWYYVGLTGFLLSAYGVVDSSWTRPGFDVACALWAEEKRTRIRVDAYPAAPEIGNWNRNCYGQYCIAHGCSVSGDGVEEADGPWWSIRRWRALAKWILGNLGLGSLLNRFISYA